MPFAYDKSHLITVAAGPAVPAGDALDPNDSVIASGTAPTEDPTANAAVMRMDGDAPSGQRVRGLVVAFFATNSAGTTQRTAGTVTAKIWWRDGRSRRWFCVNGGTAITFNHACPETVTTAFPVDADVYLQISAVAGTIVETDKVTAYVGTV